MDVFLFYFFSFFKLGAHIICYFKTDTQMHRNTHINTHTYRGGEDMDIFLIDFSICLPFVKIGSFLFALSPHKKLSLYRSYRIEKYEYWKCYEFYPLYTKYVFMSERKLYSIIEQTFVDLSGGVVFIGSK